MTDAVSDQCGSDIRSQSAQAGDTDPCLLQDTVDRLVASTVQCLFQLSFGDLPSDKVRSYSAFGTISPRIMTADLFGSRFMEERRERTVIPAQSFCSPLIVTNRITSFFL